MVTGEDGFKGWSGEEEALVEKVFTVSRVLKDGRVPANFAAYKGNDDYIKENERFGIMVSVQFLREYLGWGEIVSTDEEIRAIAEMGFENGVFCKSEIDISKNVLKEYYGHL